MERKAYPNIVRAGAQWRMMPNDLPPWHTVYQQTRRWLKAGVFEDMVRDLRMLMREINDRMPQPRAAILDSRTVQSTPESGGRAGYDGHKRRKGSKVHLAVDTLGQLLAVLVTPANEQDRAQVAALAEQIQEATGESVETGSRPTASSPRPFGLAFGRGLRPSSAEVLTPRTHEEASGASNARR
jgi:transposase